MIIYGIFAFEFIAGFACGVLSDVVIRFFWKDNSEE